MNSHSADSLPAITPINENTVLLRFADEISVEQAAKVADAAAKIQREHARFIHDCVPSYTTLLIYFDVEHIGIDDFCTRLTSTLKHWQRERENASSTTSSAQVIEIPVYYAPEVGLDLETLAQRKNLAIEDVMELHQQSIYTVYTIGFAPGFAYMGNVDQRIAEPRLASPRPLIAKGSVGIAGRQTSVYPQAMPGGWNIIGRSPLKLFDIDTHGEPRCPYKMGDRVKFFAITRAEFVDLGGEL